MLGEEVLLGDGEQESKRGRPRKIGSSSTLFLPVVMAGAPSDGDGVVGRSDH